MRVAIISILFFMVVVAIAFSQHALLLPFFIGMSTVLKGLIKTLTPKFIVLLFKNSIFLKLKQILIKASTRFFVLSHKPWRHRLRSTKASVSKSALNIIQMYMNAPLWIRTAIALGLLFATASSSYLVIALLVIPQPILNWFKNKILMTMNRTGITHLLRTCYRFSVPADVRHRLYMHLKWTMGRRQVITAKKLHNRIIDSKYLFVATPSQSPEIQPEIQPETSLATKSIEKNSTDET